jgi:hypothetical protein
MPEKRKEAEFKVSDRRLFTSDGELRPTAAEAPEPPAAPTPARAPEPESSARLIETPTPTIASPDPAAATDPETPEPPTASEQKAQHDAYRESSKDLDRRVELSGHSAKELEVTFERFMASLYMSAMMQLGLMHEQSGQPGVDLIGARQTIDTLGMVAEKTKGNLTPKEQAFLQNCLYELRMAYVEVTNAIARGPQPTGPAAGIKG